MFIHSSSPTYHTCGIKQQCVVISASGAGSKPAELWKRDLVPSVTVNPSLQGHMDFELNVNILLRVYLVEAPASIPPPPAKTSQALGYKVEELETSHHLHPQVVILYRGA